MRDTVFLDTTNVSRAVGGGLAFPEVVTKRTL